MVICPNKIPRFDFRANFDWRGQTQVKTHTRGGLRSAAHTCAGSGVVNRVLGLVQLAKKLCARFLSKLELGCIEADALQHGSFFKRLSLHPRWRYIEPNGFYGFAVNVLGKYDGGNNDWMKLAAKLLRSPSSCRFFTNSLILCESFTHSWRLYDV